MNTLELIGRNKELFKTDIKNFEDSIKEKVANSKFLILGGAGSIGQAVTEEIFKRDPKSLHVVAVKKNSLNMRSSYTDVLTPISDHFADEDIDILIVNDEADAATAMKDPEEYNQCMIVLNDMVGLPQVRAVLHVTATPQAVLGLPVTEPARHQGYRYGTPSRLSSRLEIFAVP